MPHQPSAGEMPSIRYDTIPAGACVTNSVCLCVVAALMRGSRSIGRALNILVTELTATVSQWLIAGTVPWPTGCIVWWPVGREDRRGGGGGGGDADVDDQQCFYVVHVERIYGQNSVTWQWRHAISMVPGVVTSWCSVAACVCLSVCLSVGVIIVIIIIIIFIVVSAQLYKRLRQRRMAFM